MNHISKATAVITLPARIAFAVASTGVRTTVRLVGWAAEQAARQPGPPNAPLAPVPAPRATEPDVDPMEPTRTPPPAMVAPVKRATAQKVPASQVPLKSAPTPSMPAGVEAIDAALEVPVPAPAKKAAVKKAAVKKTPAKKTPAKKTATRKAPSKKAAVLGPALGLSEDEVAER